MVSAVNYRYSVTIAVLVCALLLCSPAEAQGWVAAAWAECPTGQSITRFEGRWRVPPSPSHSKPKGHFEMYSPWIGLENTGGVNLYQPVLEWHGAENRWRILSAYFESFPFRFNTSQFVESHSGHVIHGVMKAVTSPQNASYTKYIVEAYDETAGTKSVLDPTWPRQPGYGKYSTAFVVFEKQWPCDYYPPSKRLLFYDLALECDGVPVTPVWKEWKQKAPWCGFQAIPKSSTEVLITWNTTRSTLVSTRSADAHALKTCGVSLKSFRTKSRSLVKACAIES
jgi:hypothetical protein